MKNESVKSVAYYMGLPYMIILRPDDEGDVVAKIEELPGCSSHGRNPTEALENLIEAQRLWIEDCLDAGQSVPEPTPEEVLPSGKWLQRVPRSLHQKLIRLARREGVSLNQLVTSIVAEAAGEREAKDDSSAQHQEPVLQDLATWVREGSREKWRIGNYSPVGSKLLSETLAVRRRPIKFEVPVHHDYQKSSCHQR